MTQEEKRRQESFDIRVEAAQKAYDRGYNYRIKDPISGESLPQPTVHQANGDEYIPHVPMSFTKGLPHNLETGLIKNEADFDQFVKGINSGEPIDFKRTPLGPTADLSRPSVRTEESDWCSERAKKALKARRDEDTSRDLVRAWESSSAGLAFDLQAQDAQAVTMPPAPALGSKELTAEMGEVYMQAYLRDLPFEQFNRQCKQFSTAIKVLNKLEWFGNGEREFVDDGSSSINDKNAFRGIFRGDLVGPYISQFLLIGNNGINGNDFERGVDAGRITYGAVDVDQRVRFVTPHVDFMEDWNEWIDVQNGADVRATETYSDKIPRRFIHTPRDLSTYVHYDALYEAYLNACLIMLSSGADFDPGIPFQDSDRRDHQQGFATYGGPHILTLVTEVATRALKAVRYQKFNIHRRCRPEVIAGRLFKLDDLKAVLDCDTHEHFREMNEDLAKAGVFKLLKGNKLLPMAFPEGSPMHPSYGAGHATVAGACSTILKAWFNHELKFEFGTKILNNKKSGWVLGFGKEGSSSAFESTNDGSELKRIDCESLTIEGELNKVAANVAIGRDWAGVHYYSDYVQSMIMGEEIAIGLLQEQSLTYLPSEGLEMT
ncbi:MAG: vanadium-dependent haloperoxidase, partial [Bacteroidota bacterium]